MVQPFGGLYHRCDVSAYASINLSQFIANVRTNLGPSAFYTDSEITQFINFTLRIYNCLTGFWSGQQNVSLAANRPYYVLNSTLVFGARVELDGVTLQQGTVFGWDQQNPCWMSLRGMPCEWAPVGLGILALNPIPPSGGPVLTVYGVSVTPILVNPNDKINIGQEDFSALSNCVSHFLELKSGGSEFESSKSSFKNFMASAGVRNEIIRSTKFYKRVLGLEQDKQLKRMRHLLAPLLKDSANDTGMR